MLAPSPAVSTLHQGVNFNLYSLLAGPRLNARLVLKTEMGGKGKQEKIYEEGTAKIGCKMGCFETSVDDLI